MHGRKGAAWWGTGHPSLGWSCSMCWAETGKESKTALSLMDTNPKAQSITGGFERYWQNVIIN